MPHDKLVKIDQKNISIQKLRETAIEPIIAGDIQGYDKKFWMDEISFIECILSSAGPSGALFFGFSFFLGLTSLIPFLISILAITPIAIHYLIYRFFTKPKKLKEPVIQLETILKKIVEAYNQRVETVKLLEDGEENGLFDFEEKTDVYKRLAELQTIINELVKKFRAIKRARAGAKEFKKKLENALKNPQKILPVDTTEIDLALQSNMLLQQDNLDKLGDREQELNAELQNLLAEVSA